MKSKNITKIRQARRRLQRALSIRGANIRRISHGDRDTLNDWRNVEKVEEAVSENESINEEEENSEVFFFDKLKKF